jgi:succinate dehydrogenase/fumarate reductase iron-sulfur protein
MREGDVVTLRVARWDPSCEGGPRWETWEVPYSPRMRVLDALEYANERLGADIAYRWFCGVRRCGMCAMSVNGEPQLTCWEPAQRTMTIEPLPRLPVVRDLVTDRTAYEETLRALGPRLQRTAPYPGFPEPLPDMPDVNTLSTCVECLVCHAACPAVDGGGGAAGTFPGPTAIVQLGRFVLDVRDRRDLQALGQALGLDEAQVARCRECRGCEANCPVGIPVVAAIERVAERIGQGRGAV